MDYFSVLILIVVVFTFVSDRKIKDLNIISKNFPKIKRETQKTINQLKIIKCDMENTTYDKVIEIAKNVKQKYILLQSNMLKINRDNIQVLVANYIISNKSICAYNALYTYDEKNKVAILKKLYINGINYLNIFDRYGISSFALIILEREKILNLDKKIIKKQMVTFIPNNITKIKIKDDIQKNELKNIYFKKISSASFVIILKILLLIISGSIITANLISGVLNIASNLSKFLISLIIYYCYSYIVGYIYKPIGKQKVFASYMFPIYFLLYIIITIYNFTSNSISKA